MSEEMNVKAETQKTAAEDGKTQASGNGGADSAVVAGTKSTEETQEQYYQRQLKERDELIKRREGEAHRYRKEAQELREKVKAAAPAETDGQANVQAVEVKAQPSQDEFKKIRVEMALQGVRDANKRRLIELELGSMVYGESSEEVMAAVSKAEAIVDAPFLREAARKRGIEHARDVEAAGFADVGTHGKGDRSERALHPEAAALIAEAKRQVKNH